MTKGAQELSFRVERDSLGEVRVPVSALYGPQTQRAVENFRISGITFGRPMIRALGLIKRAAAEINSELGLLDSRRAQLISRAAHEVEQGLLDEHFVVDIFQTGSGTSTNMNANEVIAARAKELAEVESLSVHPNDHVNVGQSSNDVIPSAIHLAVLTELLERLLPALDALAGALEIKAGEFSDILKTARTHLQDATPMTLGQEFGGYASQVRSAGERIRRSMPSLEEIPLGGTAVGTGINTHPDFAARLIALLRERSGLALVEARNHFEAQGAKDGLVEISGQLRVAALSLLKIANDIRWLASGPRCGLGELSLPAVQPGSSIMPGKVNPVIAESLMMVCVQVLGNDAAVSAANGLGSTFELNVMMPLMAHAVLQSVSLLAAGADNFQRRLVEGVRPNRPRLAELVEANISLATALAPKIGYDAASALAKEAYETGESLRQAALRRGVLPPEELDSVLDPQKMIKPGIAR